MLTLIDTNVFLCLAFQDPGWEHCGRLLDEVYFGRVKCVISAIQLSELYTPFKRAGDLKGLERLKRELAKLKLKVRLVDEAVATLSSEYRSTIRTPEGRWLSLGDSIVLATARLENVDVLYTIDVDFYNVKVLEVKAPDMSLEEWVRRFGTARQKRLLGFA